MKAWEKYLKEFNENKDKVLCIPAGKWSLGYACLIYPEKKQVTFKTANAMRSHLVRTDPPAEVTDRYQRQFFLFYKVNQFNKSDQYGLPKHDQTPPRRCG